MALIDDVKLSLRISSTAMNGDISGAMEAAKRELQLAGVVNIYEEDALTAQAIKIYCRYWFNWQGEGTRYRELFDRMVAGMALSQDYTGGGDDAE